MFIRKVTHQNKKNDQVYHTYKLVDSVRTERGPRQRTILNLGVDFPLPNEQWKDLANRIEEIITGQQLFFRYTDEIERLANKYAKKIISRQASVIDEPKRFATDYHTVDIDSLENEHVRTIGAEHVVLHAIQELELDRKLEELKFNQPHINAALGVIAGRLISPGSERATHKWLQDISGFDELLSTDFSSLSQDRVYKVADLLLARKEELEEHLAASERQLFSLEEKIILYDLTNTFFEGGINNGKARYGRSKEKRTDCLLVTMGLVLDADGFPKKSKFFAGNVSEGKTLPIMIDDLKGTEKPVIVMDAGIATEENIRWLKEKQYKYLVVSRKKKKAIPATVNMVTVKKDERALVQAALVENGDELELYCHSADKDKKEKSMQGAFQQRFEEGLALARTALSRKNGTKRYDKVLERIGRLKERFKRVAHQYEITVKKKGEKAIDINWRLKKAAETAGVYCLRTNLKDVKEQEIWDIYTMLTDVEDAFRCMKSELGLRPIYHQKESRSDGHLFITVLAYHILHTIRFKLRGQGIYYNWQTIRKLLSTQVRVTTTMKRADGKTIHIRKTSRAEPDHRKIYEALGLVYQPGKTEKIIM